jgi:hypothetical protein
VDNWYNITNSQNRVRKKSFGGTFCFSNCHIIRLDTGGLVFIVSVGYKDDSSGKGHLRILNFAPDFSVCCEACLHRIGADGRSKYRAI